MATLNEVFSRHLQEAILDRDNDGISKKKRIETAIQFLEEEGYLITIKKFVKNAPINNVQLSQSEYDFLKELSELCVHSTLTISTEEDYPNYIQSLKEQMAAHMGQELLKKGYLTFQENKRNLDYATIVYDMKFRLGNYKEPEKVVVPNYNNYNEFYKEFSLEFDKESSPNEYR